MHKAFDAYINALKIDEEQKLALQKRLADEKNALLNEQSRIEEEQRIIRINKQIEDGLNYKSNQFNKLAFQDSKTLDETKKAILEKLKQFFPNCYHITHKSNFHSILKHGILCWKEAHKAKRNEIDISDPNVQQLRNIKVGVNDRDIHDYAPLYLNPKNPMLYARRELHENLIILKISRGVLQNEHLFTDGNAASRNTRFSNDEKIVESCIDVLIDSYWDNYEDGKRKRCAEVLIYPSVQPKFIEEVICSNQALANELKHISPFKVTIDKSIFFK